MLPDAAATNHAAGAANEHVPTPDELGAEQVTVARDPFDVDTFALTPRPDIATVHAPEADVSTYVSTSILRSTKIEGVFKIVVTVVTGLACTEKTLLPPPT